MYEICGWAVREPSRLQTASALVSGALHFSLSRASTSRHEAASREGRFDLLEVRDLAAEGKFKTTGETEGILGVPQVEDQRSGHGEKEAPEAVDEENTKMEGDTQPKEDGPYLALGNQPCKKEELKQNRAPGHGRHTPRALNHRQNKKCQPVWHPVKWVREIVVKGSSVRPFFDCCLGYRSVEIEQGNLKSDDPPTRLG
jgi:hypothetical protein